MSDTERDSGWSEQYAETGGWPPPAEGQRSYGPGTPPADPSGAAPQQPAAGQPTRPAAPASQPDSGEPAPPGQWGQPTDQVTGGPTQPGRTGGGQAGSAR